MVTVGLVVVAVDDDVVEVEGVVVAVVVEAAVELAPGCSLATTTPTSAVALAAPSTEIRVRRRSRT